MLKRLSTTPANRLVGAVWLLNILNPLVTHHCSELISDVTPAFCEVLQLPVVFWVG